MNSSRDSDSAPELPMLQPVARWERIQQEIELVPGVITAWRAWNIMEDSGVIVLRSITHNVIWTPKQELIARCRRTEYSHHSAFDLHKPPDLAHSCGIYSLKNEQDSLLWMNHQSGHRTKVWGRVKIWGRVIEFERGYLAEFAYPEEVYVPKERQKTIDASPAEMKKAISETYDIETRIINV